MNHGVEESKKLIEHESREETRLIKDIVFKVKLNIALEKKSLHIVIKQFNSHLTNIQKCDTVLSDLNNIDELKNVVCIEYNSEGGRCTYGGVSNYSRIDRIYNKYFNEKTNTFIQTKLYELEKLKKTYIESKNKSKEFLNKFIYSSMSDEKLFRIGMRVLSHLQQQQLEKS